MNDTIVLLDSAQFTARVTLSEMMSSGTGGWHVYPVDVVHDYVGRDGNPTIPDLAEQHAAELLSRDHSPVVVVGYCAAAMLTRHLVGALAGHGHTATEILVEPTWPTWETIVAEFRRLRLQLGVRRVDDRPLEWSVAGWQAVEGMLTVLREDIEQVSRDQRLSARESELFVKAFLDKYRAWLAFLVSTAASRWPDVPCDIGILAEDSTSHVVAHDLMHVPVARADLFRTPIVRNRILAAAGRGSRTRGTSAG